MLGRIGWMIECYLYSGGEEAPKLSGWLPWLSEHDDADADADEYARQQVTERSDAG